MVELNRAARQDRDGKPIKHERKRVCLKSSTSMQSCVGSVVHLVSEHLRHLSRVGVEYCGDESLTKSPTNQARGVKESLRVAFDFSC